MRKALWLILLTTLLTPPNSDASGKKPSRQKSKSPRSSSPRRSSSQRSTTQRPAWRAPEPPAMKDESELRRRQEAKNREATKVRRKVQQLKKQQKAVTVQLEDTQQKVERTSREWRRFNAELRTTMRSLDDTKKKLAELRARLHQHLDELTDLLVAYYKNGRTGYARVLLTSDSFGDLMRRRDAVKRIVDSDNELLLLVETEQRLVRQREHELEQHQQRTEKLRGLAAEKREEYRDAASEQRQLLARITRERGAYEQYLQELEESSREIARMIRRLNAERRRQQSAGGRAPPPRAEWTGGFIRPVSGGMRSPFGYRTHPIFRIRKLHTGVDLGASYGTPIRAAGGGVVIYSGWKRGYGKTVVIDHGGDTATLYAHCSELLVGTGAAVQQGQTIARVGSTGYSTGPHLHFEVRKNGTPVNPLGLQ